MNWNKLWPHLLSVGAFLIITLIYFGPTLSGKELLQSDVIQFKGAAHESELYSKNGEEILWTNSSFGGMPNFMSSEQNLFQKVHVGIKALFPDSALLVFLGFVGFYILLVSFGVNPWLSFAGAAAYAFSTFSLISLEAGHINKVYDMVYMAPVLAGVFMTYRGKYWSGAAMTAFFLGMQVYYGHIQINYYLLYMILGIGIVELVKAIRSKQWAAFIKPSVFLVVAAMLAIGSNVVRLWSTANLAPSTTRGTSELTAKQHEGGGLDKDYVFAWSNGVIEPITTLIPYFYGGSSHESLSKDSETYQTLIKNQVPRAQADQFVNALPMYWGDQPFTAGPVYFGAIVVFLFVLGLFTIKGSLKWWAVVLALLSIFLSMGKNFPLLSDFFFYVVPLYNKFRSVTMILSIAQLIFPFLGVLAIQRFLDGQISKTDFIKGLKNTTIVVGGLCLLAIVASAMMSFRGPKDGSMGLPAWLITAIQDDRASLLRGDAFRSLILILLTGAGLWALAVEKLSVKIVTGGLCVLMLFDLVGVGLRYLNADDFKDVKAYTRQLFAPTPIDQQINTDKDPDFRVFNLATNTFNDGVTSYHHKSIGGYSAIKLGRYQELIEGQIAKNNMGVLNMLNTKYFIVPDQKTKQPQVQVNPQACGHAWFVPTVKIVANADAEMKALDNINPKQEAIVDQRFADVVKTDYKFDPASSIKLTEYHPMHMTYESNSSSEALAVFSEMYYQPGWSATIDGQETPHFRANYVLRAMMIPAGKHTIKFAFNPPSYAIGEPIGLVCSILTVLLIGFACFKEFKQPEAVAEEEGVLK
ncbi:YfhO family protein [Persicobacter psychrovividus]|uniref:Membrane protein n=1 Tax=Persicobacter psychrovividus TaxID=387638 RepID=A0ABM7VFF6_9BACT|nr:membrane protein [Persicobacter psychrovividus]